MSAQRNYSRESRWPIHVMLCLEEGQSDHDVLWFFLGDHTEPGINLLPDVGLAFAEMDPYALIRYIDHFLSSLRPESDTVLHDLWILLFHVLLALFQLFCSALNDDKIVVRPQNVPRFIVNLAIDKQDGGIEIPVIADG